MGHQAEDILKIEDIGARLDALLDALETTSQEVAKVGTSLNVPLDELSALELANQPGAMVDDSGRAVVPATRAPATPEAEVAAPDEPTASSDEEAVGIESVMEEAIASQSVEEPAGQVDQGEQEREEDGPIVDDGLLIEPEAQRAASMTDDIDGAPAGPTSLEDELDEELEALLASGMFEDPLEEAGIDESAAPVVRAEEIPEPAGIEPPNDDRKPNLPTDEAELIGELDEQLAALADMQLSDPEPPQPATGPIEEPAPVAPAPPEPKASSSPPAEPKAAAPTPEVVTRPVEAPVGRSAWRGRAERTQAALRPLGERAWAQAQRAAISSATRMSAPLRDKPAVLQIVGWVGLVHLFMAACVWTYLLIWHNPPAPVPTTPQPRLETEAR